MEFYGSLEGSQEQSFKWKLGMENRAHAAEMTVLEDADDITELVWDKKRLPRKMDKIKINCALGSIVWSFGRLQFITNPYLKRCRCPRRERSQLLQAKDGCVQPAWEGAQAPVVHVLISYFLLGCQMNTSCLFLKEQTNANDCVTFTEGNICKSLGVFFKLQKN